MNRVNIYVQLKYRVLLNNTIHQNKNKLNNTFQERFICHISLCKLPLRKLKNIPQNDL